MTESSRVAECFLSVQQAFLFNSEPGWPDMLVPSPKEDLELVFILTWLKGTGGSGSGSGWHLQPPVVLPRERQVSFTFWTQMGELQKEIFCCIPWKNALIMTAVVERTVLRDGVLGGFGQT